MIFSAPMVRALLDGRKTMTRRVLKDAPEGNCWHCDRVGPTGFQWTAEGGSPRMPCTPPYAVGDRLWVRETVRATEREDLYDGVTYIADDTWVKIKPTEAAAEQWVALNHYVQGRGTGQRTGRKVPPIHMLGRAG